MAGVSGDDGKSISSDGEVFLKQLEEEEGKYNAVLSKTSQRSLSTSKPRPRIPSLKEVGERSEGPNWTMSSPAQNLAAALNDPANREYDLFTRTWGSYFTPSAPLPPSNIPTIGLGDFLRYLKETAAGRKVHRSIVRQLHKETNDETSASPTSALPPLISQLQQDGRMYDLGSVPRIFMQADFSLADQATFQQIMPLQLGSRSPKSKGKEKGRKHSKPETSAPTNPVSTKLLHEKLSHYTDVIEVHLAYQISQRSDLFFSTLSSQQELQSHIMTVRQNAVELRLCLQELDKRLTHKNLKLMQLCICRHRHAQVLQKLKLIATVQQTQPTIQLLLSTSDFVGAIDLITTTQDVLQHDLRGVHSLRHLGSQLAEMERAIERMMEADLVHFALEDIALKVTAIGNPSLVSDICSSEERLVSVVYGLLMQSKLHFLTALRDSIIAQLKTLVKEIVKSYLHLPEVEGEGEDSSSLADCMRGMEFEAWLAMMEHLFTVLLDHLRTMQSCVKVIASVCERAAGRSKGGGVTQQQQQQQIQRQQSLDQSATTAMVEETLRKDSVSSVDPSLSLADPTDFKFKPPDTSIPSSSSSHPSLATAATPTAAGSTSSLSFDSFEVNSAQREAEEQLELLMMEDEMSYSLIGSVVPAHTWTSTQSATSNTSKRPSLSGAAGGSVATSSSTKRPSVSSVAGSKPSQKHSVHVASVGASRESETTSVRNSTGSDSSVSSGGGSRRASGAAAAQGGRGAATTAGVGEVRGLQLTVDSKEMERLEDVMAIAHVNESVQVISQTECHRLLTECHELLAASCDLVHSRCAKILNIRAKAGLLENVVSSDFVSLVRLIEHFVRSCVEVTGRHCPTLRSSLLSQTKRFLEHFHDSRKSKVSLLLDGERWKQADVPAEIQSLVHRLETGIPLLPAGKRVATPELVQPGQQASKYLMIHNQSFAVLGIVPLLVKIVLEYCQCADDLPNLVSEVMSKLIEILKFFNGRTCMLVLGAGAVETVGLKTITARHLALVLRCLQAIQLLIPDIRRHFQWRLPQKQHILLTHFVHVTEDFNRHCREINNKVMTIMDALISRHLHKWEVKSPVPSAAFKTLIKQVVKLHENLVDILPHAQLQSLFAAIEEIFKNRLRTQLLRLGITNNGSTQHGIVNSELTYLMGALGSLENVNAFRSSLFDVWTVNR